MNFLERLDALMAAQHLNKSTLSQLSGVPYTTIDGLYKKGYENAKLTTLRKLSTALGVSLNDLVGESGSSGDPQLSPEALTVAKNFDSLPQAGRRIVTVVIDELRREEKAQRLAEKPAMRIIPLLGNSFAAGPGEPDFGNLWEDYEVPADSPAEFAIRISGDSMEPHLPDGSVALCRKSLPRDGEVGAFLIDGEYLCKQMCFDITGTLHLFSLNRDRRDMDRHIPRDEIDRQVMCFGTVIMRRHIPLPVD